VTRVANGVAIVAVLVTYAFFASAGTFRFPLTSWSGSNYASLADGFLHAQLSMTAVPDPRLATVRNVYDPKDRGNIPSLWDVSLYRGRYYLYHSPVPIILFYIPLKLIARAYPPDALAALFFAACAFLASVAFLRRTLREPRIPLWLWIAMVGVGNAVPYTLDSVHIYEVAVTCAMVFSAAWAWALVRYIETPTTGAAVLMSVFVALAIAARPNLLVLVAVTVAALFHNQRALLASAIPLAIMAALLMAYNMARFGSPFEFGVTYQLTAVDMHGRHACSLRSPEEFARFANSALQYIFAPLVPSGDFPNRYPGARERIIGIAPLIPLTLIGSFFAVMMRNGDRAARYVLAGAWLVLFALSTCWWITVRYSLDFVQIMTIGSIVFVEGALAAHPSRTARAVVIALACYSIVMGVALGAFRLSLIR
jgi:hypothetical protein